MMSSGFILIATLSLSESPISLRQSSILLIK